MSRPCINTTLIALVGIDNGNANANDRKANAMFSNGQNIPEII